MDEEVEIAFSQPAEVLDALMTSPGVYEFTEPVNVVFGFPSPANVAEVKFTIDGAQAQMTTDDYLTVSFQFPR